MPARSKKQFRQMFVLAEQHKITPSQLKDFTHNVDYKHLPLRSPHKKRLDEEVGETKPDNEKTEKKK